MRDNFVKPALFAVLIILAWSAQTLASDIIVSSDPCEFGFIHAPTDDVHYQPAVDRNGNDIVPADTRDDRFEVPETVTIPLEVELNEILSKDQIPEGLDLETHIGTIEVNTKTGKATLNGQDITSGLAAYCRGQKQQAPSGHSGTDEIKSIQTQSSIKLN